VLVSIDSPLIINDTDVRERIEGERDQRVTVTDVSACTEIVFGVR